MSVLYPMSRLSPFQMVSVEVCLLPFAMGCRSLNLGEGIAVEVTHSDLGRWLASNRS